MRCSSVKRISLPAIIAALVVAGCATQLPVTQMTPAADILIRINDPALKDKAAARVSHTGGFEHVEYARFEGGGLTLEAVHDVVIGDQTVLDYHYTMDRMLETWNLNAGQAKRWGVEKSLRGWHGVIDYQPYTLMAGNRDCVAFNAEWDLSARDPFGRPMEIFFGYVCAAPGETLSGNRVEALLKSVRIDRRFGHTFVRPGMRVRFNPAAHAIATGTARSGTGNMRFPFNFGTTYTEGDGANFRN
jgi:hypothetical protein